MPTPTVNTPRRGAKAANNTAPRKSPPARPPGGVEATGPKRKLYVLVSLVGVMSLTSALLLVVRTEPVAPDASFSLMAAESADGVFQTAVPIRAGRWKYIYLHHSRTPSGDATTLADAAGGLGDHFVIGNGDGCGDGEIQIGRRWNRQESATRPPGADRMDPACVSVCLVGDFDRTYPTPAQMARVRELTASLQRRLGVGADRVWLTPTRGSAAGAGKYFPYSTFRQQLAR